MASGPITSWEIDGETVSDFIFWAPKSLQMVTAAMKLKDTYSLEEKLWPTLTACSKAETLLFQQGPSSQGYGFLVVMYGCESWTVKKAEHQRIGASELWCWRRLLRIPWTARRSNQSILKEISPGRSLEGLMLKLKPIPWPPHAKSWLIGKDPDAGRDWGQEEDRGWDDWLASPTRWTWVWVDSGSWSWTGRPGMLWFLGSQGVGHDWLTELNWNNENINLKITMKQLRKKFI